MKMSIKKIKLTVLSAMAIGVVACGGGSAPAPTPANVAPFIVGQGNNFDGSSNSSNTLFYAYNNGALQKVLSFDTSNTSIVFANTNGTPIYIAQSYGNPIQTLYSNDGYNFAPSNTPTCSNGGDFAVYYDPSSTPNQIIAVCDEYNPATSQEVFTAMYSTANGKDWTSIWQDSTGLDVGNGAVQPIQINGAYYVLVSSSVNSDGHAPYTNKWYKLVAGKLVEIPFNSTNSMPNPDQEMPMFYTNGSNLLATVNGSGNANIYKSNDLGITWTQVYTNSDYTNTIYPQFFPALNQFIGEYYNTTASQVQGIYSTNGNSGTWANFTESNASSIYSDYINGYNPQLGYLSVNSNWNISLNESQVVYSAPKMVNGNLQFNPLVNVANPPANTTNSYYYVVSSY